MEGQNANGNFVPEQVTSPLYTAGYLNTQIGKLLKVEFLMGNSFTDRTGVLVKVGVSYIILKPIDINGFVMCDIYSIKFVTIIERPTLPIFGGMNNM